MGFMEIQKSLGVTRPPEKHCSFEGNATLLFPDGRSVPVMAKLTMTRGFFWATGGGRFSCSERAAFDAVNSEGWMRLVFDGSADVEINVFEVRTGESLAHCRFEVHS